jgi:hypothetical protein
VTGPAVPAFPAGLVWLLMRPAGAGAMTVDSYPLNCGFLSTIIRRRRARLLQLITERRGLFSYEPQQHERGMGAALLE